MFLNLLSFTKANAKAKFGVKYLPHVHLHGSHAMMSAKDRLCSACRSAAMKISPETMGESGHGQRREISGEILLFVFPRETKFTTNITPFFTRHSATARTRFQLGSP